MTTFHDYMESDHRRCDALFVKAEEAAGTGQWSDAAAAFGAFHSAMEHHFTMEEDELFPALESVAGSGMGPTEVMRMEHRQMRGLFAEMGDALQQRDGAGFLGAAETLLILMQQHNMKEEHILYPMTDQMLGGEREALLQRMQALPER